MRYYSHEAFANGFFDRAQIGNFRQTPSFDRVSNRQTPLPIQNQNTVHSAPFLIIILKASFRNVNLPGNENCILIIMANEYFKLSVRKLYSELEKEHNQLMRSLKIAGPQNVSEQVKENITCIIKALHVKVHAFSDNVQLTMPALSGNAAS